MSDTIVISLNAIAMSGYGVLDKKSAFNLEVQIRSLAEEIRKTKKVSDPITPANKLPIIIHTPGVYTTRAGLKVSIHEVKPTSTLTTTAFTCKGCIHRLKANGKPKNPPEFNIWHPSGSTGLGANHPDDIVV